MAYATHLTISTADRIRLDGRFGDENEDGENENGENEVRQEVQVSVTYALDGADTDLVRLAEDKALEVKLAHEAVWNRIGAFSGRSSGRGPDCRRCSGRHEEDKDDEDDDPLAGLPHDGDDPFCGGPAPGGAARPYQAATTNRETQNGNGGPPQGGRYLPDASRSRNPTGTPEPDSEPDAEPVTGPQKILIRSRANKIGLTAYALESLLYQQFKVWRVERLTKDQAASVLAALERDLKEKNAEKNGKEQTSHADSSGRAATT
jgi:hypothetical protein